AIVSAISVFFTLSLHDALPIFIWGDFLSGGIFDLYEMVPGFFLNLIVTIVISKMGKPDEVMTDHFDKTMKNCINRRNKMRMTFRSEEHTSELQSRFDLVCRLLL